MFIARHRNIPFIHKPIAENEDQLKLGKGVLTIGFWSALISFAATMGFTIAQLLQLANLLHFPFDQVLIYSFSLCIVVPFLLALLAFHYSTAPEKRFWSHAALMFAVIYAVFVTSNYVVQLNTVIPATIYGHAESVRLLTQTPHSMFWDYDAAGYIFMGFAALCASFALRKFGHERWLKYFFLLHAIVTPLIAVVYFFPNFSEMLLLLGLPWAVTAPLCMLFLALLFKARLVHK